MGCIDTFEIFTFYILIRPREFDLKYLCYFVDEICQDALGKWHFMILVYLLEFDLDFSFLYSLL